MEDGPHGWSYGRWAWNDDWRLPPSSPDWKKWRSGSRSGIKWGKRIIAFFPSVGSPHTKKSRNGCLGGWFVWHGKRSNCFEKFHFRADLCGIWTKYCGRFNGKIVTTGIKRGNGWKWGNFSRGIIGAVWRGSNCRGKYLLWEWSALCAWGGCKEWVRGDKFLRGAGFTGDTFQSFTGAGVSADGCR